MQGPWSLPYILGGLSGLDLELLVGPLGEEALISEIKWVRSPYVLLACKAAVV